MGGKKKSGEQSQMEMLSRGIFAIAVVYHGAHGQFDTTVIRAFAELHSECLDATQKGVAPEQAAGLVLEPVLGDLERKWELASNSMGERPIVLEVANECKDTRKQQLGLEIAAAKAPQAPTPQGAGKNGELEKLKAKLESMKGELATAKAAGKAPPGGGNPGGTKGDWLTRVKAWEGENPGMCWFQSTQTGGCKKGVTCHHAKTHPDHPQHQAK